MRDSAALSFVLPWGTTPPPLDLAKIPSLAGAILPSLLTRPDCILQFDSREYHVETLTHLYLEQRNRWRQDSHLPLSIGYPLVQAQGPQGPVVLPVLLWSVTLDFLPRYPLPWRLNCRDTAGFRINPNLAELGIKVPWQGETAVEYLEKCRVHWGLEALPLDHTLQSSPSIAQIGQSNPFLAWYHSASLGAFAPHPTLDALAIPPLLAQPINPERHPFVPQILDPWQATAWQLAQQQTHTHITGPTGSGKRHLLFNLLFNALSNGERCLVVYPNFNGVNDWTKPWDKTGLQKLHYTLRQPQTEAPVLLNLIKSALVESPPPPPPISKAYAERLRQQRTLHQQLTQSYQTARQPFFQDMSWTSLVGKWYQFQRQAPSELLSTLLSAADFTFDVENYMALQESLQQGWPLFQKIETFQHPLTALHPQLFREQSVDQARHWTQEKLEVFRRRFKDLLQAFAAATAQYETQLRTHLETTTHQLFTLARALEGAIQLEIKRYGSGLMQTSGTQLRWLSPVSARNRGMLQARQTLLAHYETLRDAWHKQTLFDFEWLPPSRLGTLQPLVAQLARFSTQLGEWQQKIPQYQQEEMSRLSARSSLRALQFERKLSDLEKAMDELFEDLNRLPLLANPVQHHMLTFPKRQQVLQRQLEALVELQQRMPLFNDFHAWQRFWLSRSEPTQKLLRALVSAKAKDWTLAFQSWFFHHLLLQNQAGALPTESPALSAYRDNWEALQQLWPGQILRTWHDALTTFLRQWKKDRSRQQKPREKDTPPDFQRFYADEATLLTHFFPVWHSTPAVILRAFGAAQSPVFDWIVVLHATSIEPPMRQHLKALGHRLVELSGLAPLGGGPPELGTSTLNFVHQFRPGHLGQLFFGDQTPAAAAIRQLVIVHHALNGGYDAVSQTNSTEIAWLLQVLENLRLAQQRVLPNLALVTTTLAQRNALGEAILAKRQASQDFDAFILQLERNGLGCFHLAEVEGLQADWVIWGVTLSPSAAGLAPATEWLNEPAYLAGLTQLMEMAQQQLYISCPLPRDILQFFAQDYAHPGHVLLGNFLLLTAAWQNGDQAALQSLTLKLLQQFPGVPKDDPAPQFWDGLQSLLLPYLGPPRLKRRSVEGPTLLPLTVEPEPSSHQRSLALIADGFIAYTPMTDFNWEQEQRRWLTQNGWKFLEVWSLHWWQNPELETRKIAGQIIQLERE